MAPSNSALAAHRSHHRSSSPSTAPSPPRSSSPPSSDNSLGPGKRSNDDDSDDSGEEESRTSQPKKRRRTRQKPVGLDPDIAKDVEHLGKSVARFIEAFDPFEDILRTGMTVDHKIPDKDLKPRVRRLRSTFQQILIMDKANLIVKNIPKDIDNVPPAIALLARSLETGRSDARSEDVSTLKRHYSQWPGVSPLPGPFAVKSQTFGFYDFTLGQRLCPPDINWNEEGVRADIRSGKQAIKPDMLPRLLWKADSYDPDNEINGYLEDEELVTCATGLLLGPSVPASAGDNKSKRKGLAALAGVNKMTFPAVAYIACLYHFIISSQSMFNPDTSTSWPYGKFYREILNIAALLPDKRQKDLLDWWSMSIFGHRDDDDEPAAPASTSAPTKKLSLAARLRQAAIKQNELEEKEKAAEKARKKAEKRAKKAEKEKRKSGDATSSADGADGSVLPESNVRAPDNTV